MGLAVMVMEENKRERGKNKERGGKQLRIPSFVATDSVIEFSKSPSTPEDQIERSTIVACWSLLASCYLLVATPRYALYIIQKFFWGY
jgi:hypothetical protein